MAVEQLTAASERLVASARTKAKLGIGIHVVAAAYALWILGTFVVFYFVGGKDENALQVAVMAGAIPAGCQMLLLGVDWRGLVAPMRLWLALLLVILLSYLVNAMDWQTAPGSGGQGVIPAAWTPIVYTLNTAFVLGIATLVAGSPDRRLLRCIASVYCIFATPFLVYVDLTGEMVWGRLSAGIEPNNWGLMALTVCVAAFARKPGPIAIAGFLVGVETILLASSREHLLALAAILLVIIALYLQRMNRFRFWAVLAASCVTLVLVAVLLDPFLDAVRYVSRDVLLLDSQNRGIDSGFTGRTTIWAETFDLWLKHALFGVGFRQHEQFLAGLPAHNGYLAMLADTGLPGLIVYLVLLIRSFVASWGIQDQRTRRFALTAIVGYMIVGFFDRRAINTGNPYGLFFLLCCSVALANQSLRSVDKLWPKAAGTARGVPSAGSTLPAR